MKRMFSEEEVQKIAEAAGGGVTPEQVKEILDAALENDETTTGLVKDIVDGALQSDETTQAMVDDIIYNYLELNPPASIPDVYIHAIKIAGSNASVTLLIITNTPAPMNNILNLSAFINNKYLGDYPASGGVLVSGTVFPVYQITYSSGNFWVRYVNASGTSSDEQIQSASYSDTVRKYNS